MKMRSLVLVGGMFFASSAVAQVRLEVNLPLPEIRFEVAPPLVVVTPGIQVVEDYDDEVFFVDGFYWCRRDEHWFRTRDYHGGDWVVVEYKRVPPGLAKLKPGKYKHFKAEKAKVERASYKEKGKGHGHGKKKH